MQLAGSQGKPFARARSARGATTELRKGGSKYEGDLFIVTQAPCMEKDHAETSKNRGAGGKGNDLPVWISCWNWSYVISGMEVPSESI